MNNIPFEKSFASNEKAKYWSNKNELTPRQVFNSSGKKYIFKCDKCSHEFTSSLDKIKIGRWCPYCCIPQKKLCGSKDCLDCFEKSFASHEKATYWSDKNELKPEFVLKNGDKRIWFNCDICNHDFEKQIKCVTNDGWCPYCKSYKLCEVTNCQTCFTRSFASHEKAIYWSSKNNISARQVVQGSGIKFWFNCDKCSHTFEKTLRDITGEKDGWCPYCVSKQLCSQENCIECFNKSFASYEKSKYWSIKNKVTPRQVFKGGDSYKYLFDCNMCGLEFEGILYNITNGAWCSFCINKTEGKFYKIIKEIYPSIIYQFRVEWCKNITYLPYDFCIPEFKIIIELDGPQHFKQIMDWKSPEEQQKTDKFKEKCANDNGYCVIRLIQNDVLNDKYVWLKELCETIEELNNGDEISNVYLCKNSEYNLF
jgi:very-short-patch-repair endonuclease